jgi:hypothetical protein
MMNKKGDASFVTILLVVLGLAILVFVILAYVFGINVFDVIKRVMPNKANVDDIARSCLTYCSLTESRFNYCCIQNDVVFKDGEKSQKLYCKDVLARLGKDCSMNCDGVDCSIPPTVGCKGNAKTCAEVIMNVAEGDKQAKCEAQKVLKITASVSGDSLEEVKCKYDSSSKICAEPISTGPSVSYAVTLCSNLKLDIGTDAAKKKICETQAGCSWI